MRRRKKRRMTQQALAEKTGISVNLISAYENGRRAPRSENRHLLEATLGGFGAEEPRAAPTCGAQSGQGGLRTGPDAVADGEPWAACVHTARRLLGARDVAVHVVWRDANGEVAAIAETLDDHCLSTIRARVTPTTLDDIRALGGLVGRLGDRVHR